MSYNGQCKYKEDDGSRQVIGTFKTKKEAQVWCEEEGIDYDFYEIVGCWTPDHPLTTEKPEVSDESRDRR